jgi:hypothetical protein
MKKYWIVIVAIILIAGVALGVHLLHKDAYANVSYSVFIWHGNRANGVSNAVVHFDFFDGFDWTGPLDPSAQGGGLYTNTRPNWMVAWRIYLEEDGQWVGLDPWWGWVGEAPGSVNMVDWEVDDW